jgi:3D (Asp-Asp-Asp) domain-containing protein
MGCPTAEELRDGVTFFTTGYYKPAYGEKQGYESFECNIGMQCNCPNGDDRQPEKSCSAAGGSWRPCTPFPQGTEYCNQTSPPPVTPQAFHTAAVSSCISKGAVFKVFGSGLAEANQAVWYAEDGGAWIKGRRIDLFTGEGAAAYNKATSAGGEVTVKLCPGNNPSQCPTN